MESAILAVVLALVGSYVLTPLVHNLATRLEVIDHPGERRVHEHPTPRWGGLAIYVAFMAAVLVAVAVDRRVGIGDGVAGVIIGGTIVAVVGLLDDKYNLSPLAQIAAIAAGGAVLVAFGSKIDYVSLFGHGISLHGLTIPLTLLWIFGVTKTVDLMDGLDGLAAGICAIASASLLIMSCRSLDPVWAAHHPIPSHSFPVVRIFSAALLGASLGFLRFNYPPARIFMGTVGAQFMGFVVASSSVVGAFKVATLLAIAVPLTVLAIPIADAAFVVVKRALRGSRVYEADKTHVHHRLLDRGLSHRQAIWVIYGLTCAFSAVGLVLFWYVI